GRATTFAIPHGATLWVAAERLPELKLAQPRGRPAAELAVVAATGGGAAADVSDAAGALRELLRSRLEGLGPQTAAARAVPLGCTDSAASVALFSLEAQGAVMRGRLTGETTAEEWCERRLLARLHRYTLKRLRSEIEPATLDDYQRFLFHWQGMGSERREGREALRAVLGELEGVALPAAVWERDVLPARLVDYSYELLDQLSMSGDVVWWRPRPSNAPPAARATTVATSPIAIVPRGTLGFWRSVVAAEPPAGVSGAAQRVLAALEARGASFFIEIVQASGLLRVQVEEALGELVARGLVTADSFNGLRALLTPQSRRRGFRGRGRLRGSTGFDSAGRWALLAPPDAGAPARDEAIAHAAMALLRRYGVVARALLANETLAAGWRELLPIYRSAEARGEIRGGRFVEPLGGEQFALAEAVDELRRLR